MEPFGQTLSVFCCVALDTEQRLLEAHALPFHLRPFGRVIFRAFDVDAWPVPLLVPPLTPSLRVTGFGFFDVPLLAGEAENCDRSNVVSLMSAYATPTIENANAPVSTAARVFFRIRESSVLESSSLHCTRAEGLAFLHARPKVYPRTPKRPLNLGDR